MNRIPCIIGNWKMYKTAAEARLFISALSGEILITERRVFLSVPFTAIDAAADASTGTNIAIGAQNMHDHMEGAFTGEISARMLKASGATFVILGHSERRHYFKETNLFIHNKLIRSLHEGLTPILCIGELLHERENGTYEKVLKLHLEECLKDLSLSQASQMIIAYEPLWAVGTGKAATPDIAQEVHCFIRNWLEERFNRETAERICLVYGGSVRPDNIEALMQQTDVDGVLVGGASLDAKLFAQIVNY